MARNVPWRRQCSDATSWRQDQALNTTIFILRQTGPTGFLLQEEGEQKNFKVFLGDPHRCTCPTFLKDNDLCKHICWVLLKKFRVPRQNAVSWQLGLVEREINEILRGIAAVQGSKVSAAARKLATEADRASSAVESGQEGGVAQRVIGDEDVCPICQEELLAKHQPVTYCRKSCGNSVHIKCMKVWAEHQKSQGDQTIKCPFCREDFGPLSQLQQESRNASSRDTRAERLNEHLGTTCGKCHVCPIVNKCYKCTVCTAYHLCQACFNTATHMHHSFNFRQKTCQRWRPAPNRGDQHQLPDAVIQNLMARDLSNDDYDLLLQLDSGGAEQLSDLTEETIKSFPLERVRQNSVLLAPGQQCRVCLRAYSEGEYIRRLPCKHKFHRDCVDNWLLHRHPTCPVDGTVYSNESVRQMREALKLRNQHQLPESDGSGSRNVSGQSTRGRLRNHGSSGGSRAAEQVSLVIPGVRIAHLSETLGAHHELNSNHVQQTPLGGHLPDRSGLRRTTPVSQISHRGGQVRSEAEYMEPVNVQGLSQNLYSNGMSPVENDAGFPETEYRLRSAGGVRSAPSGVEFGEAIDFIHHHNRPPTIDMNAVFRENHNMQSPSAQIESASMQRLRMLHRKHSIASDRGERGLTDDQLRQNSAEGEQRRQMLLNTVNVNGIRVSDLLSGAFLGDGGGASAHRLADITPVTTGHVRKKASAGRPPLPPSIPLPRNQDNLSVTNVTDTNGHMSNGEHVLGRIRSRPLYRQSSDRSRSSSGSRRRKQSASGPQEDGGITAAPQGNGPLFIGNDPSSIAGFSTEFSTRFNEHHTSNHGNRNHRLHGQGHLHDNLPHSGQSECEMEMTGNALTQLTLTE